MSCWRICAGVQSGCCALISAATPATYGVEQDTPLKTPPLVPARPVVGSMDGARMSTAPGVSGVSSGPKFEPHQRSLSHETLFGSGSVLGGRKFRSDVLRLRPPHGDAAPTPITLGCLAGYSSALRLLFPVPDSIRTPAASAYSIAASITGMVPMVPPGPCGK